MRRRYFWRNIKNTIGLAMAGGIIYGLISAPSFFQATIQESIDAQLEPLGFQPIQIESISIGWGAIICRGLSTSRLMPPQQKPQQKPHVIRIHQLTLSCTVMELLRGRLSDITLDGLDLIYSGEAPPLLLPPLTEAKAGDTPVSFPPIHIHDGKLHILSASPAVFEGIYPFSLDLEPGALSHSAQIRWGDESGAKPYGEARLTMDSEKVTMTLTGQRFSFEEGPLRLTVPLLKGEALISLKNMAISGSLESQVSNVVYDAIAETKQPLRVVQQWTPQAFEASCFAGKDLLLRVSGQNPLTLENMSKNSSEVIASLLKASLSGHMADITHYVTLNPAYQITGGVKIDGTLEHPRFSFQKLSGKWQHVHVLGIDGSLQINQWSPLITAPLQSLACESIRFGDIQLTKNHLHYQVDFRQFPDTGLRVHKFTGHIFGGTLDVDSIRRVKEEILFNMKATSWDLAQLIDQAKLKDVQASGNISGNAEMSFSPTTGLDLKKATLKSISDQGVLKVTTGSHGNVAFEALEDLHFTLLNIAIRPSSDEIGKLEAAVKILGSNPKVLNGYPFEFNIKASGQLNDLITNTVMNLTRQNASQLFENNKGTQDAHKKK